MKKVYTHPEFPNTKMIMVSKPGETSALVYFEGEHIKEFERYLKEPLQKHATRLPKLQ